MILKSYVAAMDRYSVLAQEYRATMEAYNSDPSKENWINLQEAIKRLKRQDEVIKLNRWLFEAEKMYDGL